MSEASLYRWSGSLLQTNIRTLYERCQRLRLTGLMRLKQGEAVLDLMWVGGEPIEGEGDQGTRSLPLWNDGEFTVEQRMPDAKGQLTASTEMSGPLRPGQIQGIYKLCSDNVLSADVDMTRGSGETAQVRFTLGKAETATINGQTESALSALSKLSGWVDGKFRVVLRPLFGEASAAEAPVFKDKKASSDDQFDVTGSVNVDISKGPVEWPPELRAAAGAPVPMDSSSPRNPPISLSAQPAASPPASAPVPPRLAATLVTPPKPAAPAAPGGPPAGPLVLPPPNSNAPTVPMSSLKRPAPAAAAAAAPVAVPAQPKSSIGKTIAIIFVMIMLAAAGVFGAIHYIHTH